MDSFSVKKRIDHARPKGILENHLLPTFGDRPLAALTPNDGLKYVLARQAAGVVAGTIRREWQALMRLLNLGVRYDWLDKNRLKAVELPDPQRRTRIADVQELERIRHLNDRVTPEVLKELWRVIVAEPPRRLTLAFGMKAPGAGVLEFEVAPVDAEQTRMESREKGT